jgi:FlaA1/EpsC-like NDP-sugar epimerase
MRQRYFQTNASKITFILDVLVIPLSLVAALGVRSQFKDFLVSLSGALAMFSLTLLFRILSLLLFDAYTLSFATFTNADMQRIMWINWLPTLLLVLSRFLSPVEVLRMPISMIAMEYVTTTLGFIIIRSVMHNHMVASSRVLGHKKRIIVWSEIADFSKQITNVEEFCRSGRLEIMGILNGNPLYWQTEFRGLRVFGDESVLRDVIATDDRISILCFITPEELTKRRVKAIIRIAEELNLQLGTIQNEKVSVATPAEFLEITDGNDVARLERDTPAK